MPFGLSFGNNIDFCSLLLSQYLNELFQREVRNLVLSFISAQCHLRKFLHVCNRYNVIPFCKVNHVYGHISSEITFKMS